MPRVLSVGEFVRRTLAIGEDSVTDLELHRQDARRRGSGPRPLLGSRLSRGGSPASAHPLIETRPSFYRWLHGGVGSRGFPVASSSGQTTTFMPSCHWMKSPVLAIWNPRSSTAKSLKMVLVLSFSNCSLSLSESRLAARRAASMKSWQPAYAPAAWKLGTRLNS